MESYLGFDFKYVSELNCPEELFNEILECGVFGNATQAQRTAAQMTNAAIAGQGKKGEIKLNTIIHAIFPGKDWMLSFHPKLQEKPWLLPIFWVKRWGRFLKHNKENGGNLAAESMRISKKRIELLKKYGIL